MALTLWSDLTGGQALSTWRDLSLSRELASALLAHLRAAGQLLRGGSVMLALGPFLFSIETAAYQQLSRSIEFVWAAQERIGRRPGRQFLGVGEEAIELTGYILPAWKGGTGQLVALRALGSLGQPLLLIDGRGNLWGKWCITSVSETGKEVTANGGVRLQEFSVSLVHYGDSL